MSTPAHFNSEIILQTVRAQSSRVPTPLPDDPYVAVRQAHLVDMDTESGPVKDLRETEVPQPLVVVPSLIPSSDVLHLTVGQAHTPAIVGTEFEPEEAPSETEEFKASEPSDTRITSSHSSASSDSTAPLSPDHPLTQTSPTPTPTRVSFTMDTRASNSELVEPLPEPERTLNRRLRRRNRRVPYDQRTNPPQYPRIVYPPILDINHFCHFLDILLNYNPMDDEPMWAADHVVALTLGSAITIPETVNEFAIKALFDRLLGEIRAFSQHENESLTDAWLCMKEILQNCHGQNLSKGNIIKIFYHGLSEITQEVLNAAAGGIFIYKTNQAYQLLEDKVLLKLDWAKNQKTKSSLKKTVAFTDEGSSNTDTDKNMARMDAMTIKMDAQYKELQSRAK
ncbi:hypothetical protein Tco_0923224 [Tanacetum coccineum]|uniref:Reverse transcriptase domain-containing protein n=1 Tax=Tanacetum coccineum TaxID=301880 RepID=A0ABQ5D0D9_9ASTR